VKTVNDIPVKDRRQL